MTSDNKTHLTHAQVAVLEHYQQEAMLLPKRPLTDTPDIKTETRRKELREAYLASTQKNFLPYTHLVQHDLENIISRIQTTPSLHIDNEAMRSLTEQITSIKSQDQESVQQVRNLNDLYDTQLNMFGKQIQAMPDGETKTSARRQLSTGISLFELASSLAADL